MGRRTEYFNDPNAPIPNSIVAAVTAVVSHHNGHILLIHRTDNNLWALPGGAMEIGENITSTVVREVHEESGIQVEVLNIVGIYTNPKHIVAFEDGEVRQQFSICFRANPIGGTLRSQPGETSDARWVPPDELDNLNIHPSQRLRIKHGLDGNRSPYIG